MAAQQYFNTSIRNLTYCLRRFREILNDELKDEILNNADVIIEMVAQNQLYEQGIEGRGVSIMSYRPYAPRTIKKKQKKGQPYDRVTLRDTGEFHASLRVESDENGFYIVSSDEKAEYLLERYGTTIFRLTNENLKELLNNYIRPSLAKKLKAKILNDRT